MSWFKHTTRAAAALLVIALAGCVTTVPGYHHTADMGGDYYYDERPAVTTSVHVLPAYDAFGDSLPGRWYGSVGFGFGTYYGPLWGAFGPRYGHAGYWHPPYYYKPRYSRPRHDDRPPFSPVRPLPWWSHDRASAWQQRRGRGSENAWVAGAGPNRGSRLSPSPRRMRTPATRPGIPRVREAPRNWTDRVSPGAPLRRAQSAIIAPSRQPISPSPRQAIRAVGGHRRALAGASRLRDAATAPSNHESSPAAPSGAMAQPEIRRRGVLRPRPVR